MENTNNQNQNQDQWDLEMKHALGQIRWFAFERKLNAQQIKDIFMDGVMLNVQNGKLESRSITTEELKNLRAVR